MRKHCHRRKSYDLSWIGTITLIISIGFGPIGIGIWFLLKYLVDKFGDVVLIAVIICMMAVKSIMDI